MIALASGTPGVGTNGRDAEVQMTMEIAESPQTQALSMQLIDGTSHRTVVVESVSLCDRAFLGM